jgi:hypothetical protein
MRELSSLESAQCISDVTSSDVWLTAYTVWVILVTRSNGNENDNIILPAVRKDFWELLISRHPIEEDYAPSTKNAYRWCSIPELRLVIVQFVSQHGVGVFVRGEKGASFLTQRN